VRDPSNRRNRSNSSRYAPGASFPPLLLATLQVISFSDKAAAPGLQTSRHNVCCSVPQVTFLARRALAEGQEYHGRRVLACDSVKGRPLAASATKQCQSLYEYND